MNNQFYMDVIEKVALTDEQKMEIKNLKQQNKNIKRECNDKVKQLPGYRKYDAINKLLGVTMAYNLRRTAKNLRNNVPLHKAVKPNLTSLGAGLVGGALLKDMYCDKIKPTTKPYFDQIRNNKQKIREIKRA